MDCKTAQHVWNHQGGFIAGINCRFKGLLIFLTDQAFAFTQGDQNPFDTAVKAKAGNGKYLVIHSDDSSVMSRMVHDVLGDKVANRIISEYVGKAVNLPTLQLANICCNGCSISDGSLSPEQELAIQMAAVNTNPDGTTIVP
ncbi:MAG: hypothetical protein HYZ54_09960 [Ignavibacteriae bacterium]|nr:hypothetical protein [Ignavibacteriota bacterium]